MTSISEALGSGSKNSQLASMLAAGVRTLSGEQQIDFSLYQRYVFPLDGLNYWIKINQTGTIVTPGIQTIPGMATRTPQVNETVQVSPGGFAAVNIVGGIIINPLDAADQGLPVAESLFVDLTGPAYHYVTATTYELLPGESIEIPANCTTGAWVCAASKYHRFTCVLQKSIPSVTLPTDVQVKGSLHYSTEIEQREDAIVDSNLVIFTSLSEIQPFNQIGPDHMYIAHYRDITFAFSSRGRLYEQADLYHYVGRALFSVNATQIIDDITQFNPTLVNNTSLPIWLYMPLYVPPYPGFVCPFPLYPSYLVDDNLTPPFGSVHIDDTETLSLGTYFDPRMKSYQLSKERVKVHIYGASARMAGDFVSFVEQYSKDWMNLGLVDSPTIKDEKNKQAEFKILSQYKCVTFEINYQQITVRDIARQFIEHVKVQFYTQWLLDPDPPNNSGGIIGELHASNICNSAVASRLPNP